MGTVILDISRFDIFLSYFFTRRFSEDELKPQPIIRKRRKQFVPDEMKNSKYEYK